MSRCFAFLCFAIFPALTTLSLATAVRDYFSVILAPQNQTFSIATLSADYSALLQLALSRYTGPALSGSLSVPDIHSSELSSIPLHTVLLTPSGLSRDSSAAELVAIMGLVSAQEASQRLGLTVVSLFQLSGQSLIVERDGLVDKLWIMIPVVLPAFLLASLVLLVCYCISPDLTDPHISGTNPGLFRQTRRWPWTHSSSKVARILDSPGTGMESRGVNNPAWSPDAEDYPHKYHPSEVQDSPAAGKLFKPVPHSGTEGEEGADPVATLDVESGIGAEESDSSFLKSVSDPCLVLLALVRG